MPSPRRRSLFRPCIDLHDGQVKQIVGGTLSDRDPEGLQTNFVARHVPCSSFGIHGLTDSLSVSSVNLLQSLHDFIEIMDCTAVMSSN